MPKESFKCSRDGLFPDMEDCSRFYECFNRKITHLTCSQGLVFNEKTQTCDVMKNVPECNYSISDEVVEVTQERDSSDPNDEDGSESDVLNINIQLMNKNVDNNDNKNNGGVTDLTDNIPVERNQQTVVHAGHFNEQGLSIVQRNRFKVGEHTQEEMPKSDIKQESIDYLTLDEINRNLKTKEHKYCAKQSQTRRR